MVFDRLIYLNPGSEALLKQLKSDCQGIKVQQRNGSDQLVFKFNNPESQTAFNAFLASIPIGYTPLDSNIEPDDQTLTINIMASKNLLGCQNDSFGVAYEPLPQHMSFAEMRRQTDRDIRNLFDTMGCHLPLQSGGPLPMPKVPKQEDISQLVYNDSNGHEWYQNITDATKGDDANLQEIKGVFDKFAEVLCETALEPEKVEVRAKVEEAKRNF